MCHAKFASQLLVSVLVSGGRLHRRDLGRDSFRTFGYSSESSHRLALSSRGDLPFSSGFYAPLTTSMVCRRSLPP